MKRCMLFLMFFVYIENCDAVDVLNLDHPVAIGVLSSLVLESSSRASLVCFAHWFLKNRNHIENQSSIEQIISYSLGSLLGQCLKPEIKSVWKEFKSILSIRAKMYKFISSKSN